MTDSKRRGQLILAAYRVLVHYGPRKATVVDIAHAAGIGVGSVYLEFRSKGALVAAVYHHLLDRALRAMLNALGEHLDEVDAIGALIDARTRAYWDMGRGGPHAKDLTQPDCSALHKVWMGHRTQVFELISTTLAQGHTKGTAHAPDPDRTTDAILLAYSAFEPPRLVDPGSCLAPLSAEIEAVMDAVAAVHEVVLAGLRPR